MTLAHFRAISENVSRDIVDDLSELEFSKYLKSKFWLKTQLSIVVG